MTLDLYFDMLGIQLNGPAADDKLIVLNWNVTYPNGELDDYVLSLENSALTYIGPQRQSATADATLRMTRATLDDIKTGVLTWQQAIHSGASCRGRGLSGTRGLWHHPGLARNARPARRPTGRAPFLETIVTNPAKRADRLQEAVIVTAWHCAGSFRGSRAGG